MTRSGVIVCFGLLVALPACRQVEHVAPAAVTEGFITTDDGIDLYYRSVGAGRQTLVVPMALYLQAPLAPLAANRRVVFYDPRNRGRSEASGLDHVSLERQVADLEALRSQLRIERMALLGWSGLGMEMAVYALRYPARVTRLVQVSPVPPAASIMQSGGDVRAEAVDQEALDELDRQAGLGVFEGRPAEYCRRYNAITLPGSFADGALAGRVPDPCEHENEWPENLWPYFGALLPSFGDYDWRPGLRALSLPRLVIHGREDGIPLAGAVAWVEGYDAARLLVLSPAGHFPFIEQREKFLAAVETFLDGRWPAGAEALPAATPE